MTTLQDFILRLKSQVFVSCLCKIPGSVEITPSSYTVLIFFFYSQHEEERERLHQQLRELQNNLTLLTRECEEKQKQIDELQMEHELMQTAVSSLISFFLIILTVFGCKQTLFAIGFKAFLYKHVEKSVEVLTNFIKSCKGYEIEIDLLYTSLCRN